MSERDPQGMARLQAVVTSLIRHRVETRGDKVTDLHLWQIGPGHRAAVISVFSCRCGPSR